MADDIKWKKVHDYKHDGENALEVGNVKPITIDNKHICLARTEKGYFAVNDNCPHAGGRLGMGWCEGNYVVCPIHRYKYNLDNGRGAPQQGDYVNTYPVDMREDGIYIGFKKRRFRLW